MAPAPHFSIFPPSDSIREAVVDQADGLTAMWNQTAVLEIRPSTSLQGLCCE